MTDDDAQARETRGSKTNRRKHDRHIVLLKPVLLQTDAAREYQAHVSEISVFGCRLYTRAHLFADDRVALCLDDLEMVEADVKWVDGPRAGCRFHLPIGLDVIKQLMLRAD